MPPSPFPSAVPIGRRRLLPLLLLAVLLSSALPGSAAAAGAPTTEKGLLITPLRQFVSADAGSSAHSTFSVANLTNQPLNIQLSVQQFSVANYTYNYRFTQPTNNWLHLAQTTTALAPHHTQTIDYHLDVPAGTAPGGHYYTLLASANLAAQGVNNTIQAADLLYFTVNGRLNHSSRLTGGSIPRLSFGASIPFTMQAVNTGNVYFFVYTTGQLHGWFVRPAGSPETHMLMPGKVRTLDGHIASPILPGVYRATYGYKTDAGQTVSQSRLIIFIPPWSIALLLGLLLIFGNTLRRRKRRPAAQPDSQGPDPAP